MSEGLPGFIKAMKLVDYLEGLELTDEEITEAHEHFRRADGSHGLLWGNIQNFGRESKALELMSLLCQIQRDIKTWRNDSAYPLAVVAGHLRKTQEVIANAD